MGVTVIWYIALWPVIKRPPLLWHCVTPTLVIHPLLSPCPRARQSQQRARQTERVLTSSRTVTPPEWCTWPRGRPTTYVFFLAIAYRWRRSPSLRELADPSLPRFRKPSISPRTPSRNSKTSNVNGSVWRSASCSATNTRRRQPRLAGRPGPLSSPRSHDSKSWKSGSRLRPSLRQRLLVPRLRSLSHLLTFRSRIGIRKSRR